MIKILCIKIVDRIKEVGLTQDILSKYVGLITTRLGFHEITDELCSREACIILHLSGDSSKFSELDNDLKRIGGIEIRAMEFDGDSDSASLENADNASVIGILVEQNTGMVKEVQKILTSYGCYIRTRLGVNEIFHGRPAGLIILELIGDTKQRYLLTKELSVLKKVHVRALML
jgi:hypothetical protein